MQRAWVIIFLLMASTTRAAKPEALSSESLISPLNSFSGKVELLAPANVKVRLKRDLEELNLNGQGLNWQGPVIAAAHLSNEQKEISVRLSELNDFPLWTIQQIQPNGLRHVMSQKVRITSQSLRADSQPLPKEIELVAKNNGRFDVLATLELEQYLFGVLPSEMPASWPLEALKAQAVASRSYTLNALKQAEYHYDVEATIHDQVYQYMAKSKLAPRFAKKVLAAIHSTQNEILVKKNGEVLRAYFHANCGGQTEEPFRVWGNHERSGTAVDSFCPRGPNAHWSWQVSAHQLQNAFHKRGISNVKVRDRSQSGRVMHLEIFDEAGNASTVTAQKFRQILGFNKVKSANFEIAWANHRLTINGHGHGHGVGLCQWGARYLASRGYNYRQILKHYYPNAKLVRSVKTVAATKLGI